MAGESAFAKVIVEYGDEVRVRLSANKNEAQLTVPVSGLIEKSAKLISLTATADREISELDGTVRPDFAVRVDKLMVGHVELKAPGTSLDPTTYAPNSHNGKQWQKLRELPNLLHTNGQEFRLWRYGELVDDPAHVHAADLATFKGPLTASPRLEGLLDNFLSWKPLPITSVGKLVDALSPLARLLREEVLDALRQERKAIKGGADRDLMPFTGIAKDWRRLLMPHANDAEFADGFAQTIIFALLLALDDGIDLGHETISEIAKHLEAHHTLMGRALNLLTEHIGKTPVWTAIETIVRIISVTNWKQLQKSGNDLYLHLYEDFLAAYDPEKRRKSGSYYTPVEVVDSMVRLTDDALKTYLGKAEGLRNPNVSIIDPAMGTGTYPLSVLRHVGQAAEAQYGPGARPEAVSNALARLYGIEIQSGPFSVAELRVTSVVQDLGAAFPKDGLNLFVADTLEDPASGSDTQLSYTLQLIARQRQRANKVKREQNIQVCIGNPPYKDHAGGMGGWIESGVDAATGLPPLAAFKLPGNGKHERHLSNLYAYFWRWATWKVFESTDQPDIVDGGNGIVCFITATGYLAGPGFKGMREYLRRECSHGWIINITPEGKQPPAANAVFAIETPVAIGIFLRGEGTDRSTPADIKYIALHGKRQVKFAELAALKLDATEWQSARTAWAAPFTPAAATAWDEHPATEDLMPWRQNGIMAGRGWVYAPSQDVLEARLRDLINEDDPVKKAAKFPDARDANLQKTKRPLAGTDTEQDTSTPFDSIAMFTQGKFVRCGFRVLDRQWLIADSRLLSQPSPKLWAARISGQVFAIELHSEYPRSGPGVVYSSLIPDVHHFRGSGGGRTLPKLHADGSPNVATGLTAALSARLGLSVTAEDVFDYVAGVTGHPGYVEMFDDELHTPGVRVPITSDAALWREAVEMGRHVQWLQTYGEAGAHPDGFTDVRDSNIDITHPSYVKAVGPAMPTSYAYDAESQALNVGSGQWKDVAPEAAAYTVGGSNVLNSWLDYRLATPRKRRTSPLDEINSPQWDSAWSNELTNLLSILTQLVDLTDDASDLLGRIVAGPLLTRTDLAKDGVEWPTTEADHGPRGNVAEGLFAATEG